MSRRLSRAFRSTPSTFSCLAIWPSWETSADPVRQRKYVSAGLRRAGKLGAKVVVFGSGRSRMVPLGYDKSRATEQIEEFLRLARRLRRISDITIALEPLNREECNIVNSVPEALAIAQAVDRPHIRVLSDLYHVAKESQPYSETAAAGDFLAHVHVAGAENRRIPDARDSDYLTAYFSHLKQIGYDARISIEGKIDDLSGQGPEALEVLRKAWETA